MNNTKAKYAKIAVPTIIGETKSNKRRRCSCAVRVDRESLFLMRLKYVKPAVAAMIMGEYWRSK